MVSWQSAKYYKGIITIIFCVAVFHVSIFQFYEITLSWTFLKSHSDGSNQRECYYLYINILIHFSAFLDKQHILIN